MGVLAESTDSQVRPRESHPWPGVGPGLSFQQAARRSDAPFAPGMARVLFLRMRLWKSPASEIKLSQPGV